MTSRHWWHSRVSKWPRAEVSHPSSCCSLHDGTKMPSPPPPPISPFDKCFILLQSGHQPFWEAPICHHFLWYCITSFNTVTGFKCPLVLWLVRGSAMSRVHPWNDLFNFSFALIGSVKDCLHLLCDVNRTHRSYTQNLSDKEINPGNKNANNIVIWKAVYISNRTFTPGKKVILNYSETHRRGENQRWTCLYRLKHLQTSSCRCSTGCVIVMQ